MANVTVPGITIENKALVLDLLEWVSARPRTYVEVMDAWRTSCPRLPVWEDANELGFVSRAAGADGCAMVVVTAAGAALLAAERPTSSAAGS
jgi:D-3-phosphoglycerate dehydrogenase